MTKSIKKEAGLSTGVGVPDSSGGRGGGRIHKAYQRGGAKYPYDKAAGAPGYGSPLAYDRGNSGNGGSRQNVNMPKNVKPDAIDKWQGDIEESSELDGWKSATPAQGNIVYDPREKSRFGKDEDLEEGLGSPSNAAKAGGGTGGTTGGRVTPGTSGEWGGRPKGPDWDNTKSDEELTIASRQDEYGYGMIRTTAANGEEEKVPVAPTYDTELGKGAVILKVGGAGFGTVGKAMKQARMQPGMAVRETKRIKNHSKLVEAFVSLTATEDGCLDTSSSVQDVDKSIQTKDFVAVSNVARGLLSRFEEGDMVKLMMKIDPDYFAKSFGKIGKLEILNTYEQWSNDTASKDGDIDKMTERILKVCGENK